MRNSGLDKAVLVGMEEVADIKYILEVKGMRLTDELDMGVKKKEESRKTPRFEFKTRVGGVAIYMLGKSKE